jgi:protoporphyrinogen oxidase
MLGRIVIVGAGPTGLGASYRLREAGHQDWEVYEKRMPTSAVCRQAS